MIGLKDYFMDEISPWENHQQSHLIKLRSLKQNFLVYQGKNKFYVESQESDNQKSLASKSLKLKKKRNFWDKINGVNRQKGEFSRRETQDLSKITIKIDSKLKVKQKKTFTLNFFKRSPEKKKTETEASVADRPIKQLPMKQLPVHSHSERRTYRSFSSTRSVFL